VIYPGLQRIVDPGLQTSSEQRRGEAPDEADLGRARNQKASVHVLF
jgi:hypothetical protein